MILVLTFPLNKVNKVSRWRQSLILLVLPGRAGSMADAVEDMEVASFKKGNRKRLLLLLWFNSKSIGMFLTLPEDACTFS